MDWTTGVATVTGNETGCPPKVALSVTGPPSRRPSTVGPFATAIVGSLEVHSPMYGATSNVVGVQVIAGGTGVHAYVARTASVLAWAALTVSGVVTGVSETRVPTTTVVVAVTPRYV